MLAALYLPHPSKMRQQAHTVEVVGREGCVVNIPSPRRLGRLEMLLKELLTESGAAAHSFPPWEGGITCLC